jgi:hypothetical protein
MKKGTVMNYDWTKQELSIGNKLGKLSAGPSQGGHEFQASLSYIARPCLKNK